MLKCFYINLVIQISSGRKIKRNFGKSKFKCFENRLGDVRRTSWGRHGSTSQGPPLNVRLGRPLDVISGCPLDIRSGLPRDGQIESLGDVLGTLKMDVLRTSLGPMFAGWELSNV